MRCAKRIAADKNANTCCSCSTPPPPLPRRPPVPSRSQSNRVRTPKKNARFLVVVLCASPAAAEHHSNYPTNCAALARIKYAEPRCSGVRRAPSGDLYAIYPLHGFVCTSGGHGREKKQQAQSRHKNALTLCVRFCGIYCTYIHIDDIA